MTTVSVPAKFNGPPASGNGGYSCGVLAKRFDGPAAVSLKRHIPLDRAVELRFEDDGAMRAFSDGETIAEAVAATPLAPWDGPTIDLDAARAAHDRFAPAGSGTFDTCFVCGRARPDGLHVFSGPTNFDGVVASHWTPPDWAADEDGAVLPEFVWAVLDCPGYFALHGGDLAVAYLVRQQVEIVTPPRVGVEYVVAGRALERSGRKGLAATAILDAEGEVLAHAECLLVAPRQAVDPTGVGE
ncbi:MAG: hypothetical protein QM729_15355 [Solirubrobacterales bacterium]